MTGYLLVMAAGVFQGSFMLPMKFTKRWAWENSWLIFSSTAYLVWPWLFVFLTLSHVGATYASVSNRSLLIVALFGVGWGLGALTFGLGVDKLGIALGYTVIVGLAASVGTLIPMVVLSPGKLMQIQGRLTIAALLLVLAGISLCSWAGNLRNPEEVSAKGRRRSFALGLVICVLSGVLSSFGNLGFAFGNEVVQKAIEQGTPPSVAGNALWALLTIPLFICNAGYSAWLLSKRGTLSKFFQTGIHPYWILGALMGFLWFAGFAC